MRNPVFEPINRLLTLAFFAFLIPGCLQKNNYESSAKEGYDNPDMAARFEFDRTKDPATGKVPREKLMYALRYTDSLKSELPFQLTSGYGTWTERGPNSDAVGVSNGNTRANNGKTAGRIRAVWVDLADGTGNTVWVGGVAGGIWKTTNITLTTPVWTLANDFLSNMAITGICQDPSNTNVMYACTGEAFYNSDAVAGDGVFKSTDNGATWNQLAATTGANFDYCTKILCDASGNVYLTTRSGVFRSNDGGANWTTITPSGLATSRFSDMELSSTGRLHVSAGIFSTCAYRFTDNPSTVSSAGWTSPTSGYPSSGVRIELGCNGNNLYALPSDGSYQVPIIYKSTNGGATWSSTVGQPTSGWGSGQAWYNLAVDIDGSGDVIVGALEPYRSINGGNSWSKIANWVGTSGQYVHADIHNIKMYGANRVLFGCDGGIHYSSDGGNTIRDRNEGLRLKQFYSCAMHPLLTNYFLAGAQDNGSHQFSNAGLGATVEVTGGDGAFVHIDQDQPTFQFTSYVYNRYRRSIDGGNTWAAVDLSTNTGQFINPTDYDDAANIMYCGSSAGTYRRWTNAQTGSSSAEVAITALNGNAVTAVTVSPHTSNRVYFGTSGATPGICYVNNANSIASGSAGTSINTGLPGNVTASCIAVGTDDQNLLVSYTNYGVASIWRSTDGGTSWTSLDNNGVNLPDMPVRWCMFAPNNNNAAIIATEAGVYFTHSFNGTSTVWIPSPSFPTVRTDMLQYRPSDGLIAAATHGRGLWTQPYLTIVPVNKFLLRGKWSGNNTDLQWEYIKPAGSSAVLDIEISTDAVRFSKVGTLPAHSGNSYSFSYKPTQQKVYYRIKAVEANGLTKYSNTIRLFKNGGKDDVQITSLYPNPVLNDLNVAFIAEKGMASFSISSSGGQSIWRKEEDLEFSGAWIKNWNITHLKPGVYFLSLRSNGKTITQRFVKK